MQGELSDNTFQQRLTYIGRHLAYVDIKPQSPIIILALHEHPGLANYFRIIIQALSNNQFSIVIPNLFGEVVDQTNRQEKDEDILERLEQSIIAQTVWEVMEQIKPYNKKVILLGFSIGAAVGLRMLEFLKGIELAMLFYGLPPLEQTRPEAICTRTIIYLATKDKVKHLSDKHMQAAFLLKYADNKMVQVYELEGVDHGFMNPASQHYEQEAFNDCCTHFQQLVHKLIEGEERKEEKIVKEERQREREREEGNEDAAVQGKKQENAC